MGIALAGMNFQDFLIELSGVFVPTHPVVCIAYAEVCIGQVSGICTCELRFEFNAVLEGAQGFCVAFQVHVSVAQGDPVSGVLGIGMRGLLVRVGCGFQFVMFTIVHAQGLPAV